MSFTAISSAKVTTKIYLKRRKLYNSIHKNEYIVPEIHLNMK